MVQFFDRRELLKTHPRKQRGKQTDLADYPPEKVAHFMRTPAWCRRQAAGIGPACTQVIEELMADNALYRLRAAQGVIGLGGKHDTARLEAACARAIEAGDPSYKTIRGILAAGTETWPPAAPAHAASAGAFLRGPGEDLRERPPLPRHGPRRRRGPGRHALRAPRGPRAPGHPGTTRPPQARQGGAGRSRPGPPGHRARCRRRRTPPMTAITDTNGLSAALRTLKLSGMLGTLEARLAQARAGDLGHLEFLQVLCEDEISRRSGAAIGRRLHRARFDEQATFEGFDFTASPGIPAAAIRDLAALRWLPPANQSSCPAQSESARPSSPAPSATTPAVPATPSASPRPAGSSPTSPAGAPTALGTTASEAGRARPPHLDHFALRDFTPAQADDLYELLTERHRHARYHHLEPQPDDWYSLFPNPVVAESMLDRLINTSHHIAMNGPSYRPNKRPGAPQRAIPQETETIM